MKRVTLNLPDDLYARLRDEAGRRNSTVSEIARRALDAHLAPAGGYRVLGAAGAGDSGASDISERIEELLATDRGGQRTNAT